MSAKKFSPETQSCAAIRRYLRHKGSREYYKEGGWTHDPAEARQFVDVIEVAETCVQNGLSDVELALRYETGVCDLFCTPIR